MENGAGSLDPLDRRIEHEYPSGEHVVLVWLHVSRANTHQRARVDRELRRRRRCEDDLLCPLEGSRRQLETGILLADDEDALARVGLGRARVGIVRDIFDAGDLRPPGLRDADREDRDLAAVLAVSGLEHPAIAITPRRRPPAAVADRDAGALREGGEIPFHFRARWVIRSAVHHRAHQRAAILLLG